MKGQRILITGGLGFIGSNLAHACYSQGAKVTIYDSFSPKSGGNMYNLDGIRDQVEFIHGDILDFEEIVRHIKAKDILFNCAATTSHSLSMREPWLDLDTNIKGVLNLLEAAREYNPGIRFIQVGTSTQLGRQKVDCADENQPEFPMDVYSVNKSAAEKYVLIYGHTYDMFVSVLRLSNVYGPRAAIKNAALTFNNYFIGLALQGKDVTIYGDGAQQRNIIYVQDVVAALMMAAQNVKARGEVFFCCGDKHLSVAQIAQETVNILGSGRTKFVPWPQDPSKTDVGNVHLNNAKIKNSLGWKPCVDFKSGLLKTKEYYQGCLDKYLN